MSEYLQESSADIIIIQNDAVIRKGLHMENFLIFDIKIHYNDDNFTKCLGKERMSLRYMTLV